MEDGFDEDIFSFHFNMMRYLGFWTIDTKNKMKRDLYQIYNVGSVIYGMTIPIMGLVDLYQWRHNFEKVALNLCITSLSCGIFIKNVYLLRRSHHINNLRRYLYKDHLMQHDSEDLKIRQKYYVTLIRLKNVFYIALYTLLPLWWLTSVFTLKWGPRELPFPVWMPLNIEEDWQYYFGLFYQIFGSLHVLLQTVHADLAMFSLYLQIGVQYNILLKDTLKIKELYVGGSRFAPGTVDEWRHKTSADVRTKEILRKSAERQLVILSYVKQLEFSYNQIMLLQLFTGFLLLLGNGLKMIMTSVNFSLKIFCQYGYTIVILCDIFMVCTLATHLLELNKAFSWAVYDTPWYEMANHVRKDIVMIAIGSQKVTPLTAGKFFQLNLPTCLGMTNNVLSWLALFRQVVIKS